MGFDWKNGLIGALLALSIVMAILGCMIFVISITDLFLGRATDWTTIWLIASFLAMYGGTFTLCGILVGRR